MKTFLTRSLAGLAAFAALASAPLSANAAVLTLQGPLSFGQFSHSDIGGGNFTDTLDFTMTEDAVFAATISSVTTRLAAAGDINFTSVVLSGAQGSFDFAIANDMTIPGQEGWNDLAMFGRVLAAGDYRVTIKGFSYGGAVYVGSTNTREVPTSAAPEPSSWALMILGFGGAGAALRSRRRAAVA